MSAQLVASSHVMFHAVSSAAKGASTGGPSVAEQIAFLAVSAVFGFACSYALARLNSRREPRREVSWDTTVDRGLVAVGAGIRENVSIRYKGEDVKDLVAIKCRLSNTGNRVVKKEEVRIAFGSGTRILDTYFEPQPQPEPELRTTIVPPAATRPLERRITIGHLETTQEVIVRLIVTGPNDVEYQLHGFNEEGDVRFQQREVNRISDEQDHVVPFIFTLTLLIVLPQIFGGFLNIGDSTVLSDLFSNTARLILLIFLAPHILPVARIIQRLTRRALIQPQPTTSVTVEGENAQVVATSGSVHNLEFRPHEPPS
jgi:hypothetical protein